MRRSLIAQVIDHHVEVIALTKGVNTPKYKDLGIGQVIERGARTCYNSFDKMGEGTDEKLFNTIVKQHHHNSVSEHGVVTFNITTSRSVMTQITRHRIASYSVESQRYCKYGNTKHGELKVIPPMKLRSEEAFKIWEDGMNRDEEAYAELLVLGEKPEDAREVLSNSVAVNMQMTINVSSLRNFLKLRLDKTAQPAIRHVAELMVAALHDTEDFPNYLIEDVVEGDGHE